MEWGTYTKTNILLKLESEDDELSQISVFADVDASSSTARSYQMFVLATTPPDGFGAKGMQPIPTVCKTNRCMYRLKSTDALHWTSVFPQDHTMFLFISLQ